MKNIYEVLHELQITYTKHEHPAVYTVEEAEQYDRDIEAGKSKNLFLRNKKGSRYYLVVIESTKRVNLETLAKALEENKFGFASADNLMNYLGLTAGSVSPFGLINDKDKAVHVVVDTDLLKHEKLAYHPNINTETLVISTKDLKNFLEWTGNKVSYLDL